MEMLGNNAIWELPRTAFLCSRKVPAAQVLKCYDWAIAMRNAGTCVMLGAHSQLEKDVLHYLLKGEQPIVIVLARGLKKKLEPELEPYVQRGRLLIVSPFEQRVQRVTQATAEVRNRFISAHAERIVFGHVPPEGRTARVYAMHTERSMVLEP